MKNILYFWILLGMISCDIPCAEIVKVTDRGELPDEVIDYLPYDNKDEVTFIHPQDSLIQLAVYRETMLKYAYSQDECASITIRYEKDSTGMESDASDLAVQIWTTNFEIVHWYAVTIGDSRFLIPVSDQYRAVADISDSLVINGTTYYEVFRLPEEQPDEKGTAEIRADTLLFNTEFGILEIMMSDGNNYLLVNE